MFVFVVGFGWVPGPSLVPGFLFGPGFWLVFGGFGFGSGYLGLPLPYLAPLHELNEINADTQLCSIFIPFVESV